MPSDEELEAMSDAALLDEMRQARVDSRTIVNPHLVRLGRAAAKLHDTRGWSWPQIGREMGVSASTAWRWAEPYLQR